MYHAFPPVLGLSAKVATVSIALIMLISESILGQQEQKLTASDGVEADYFGGAVAISGDIILVGAHTYSEFDPYPGFVYVFRNEGGVWTETQKLVPNDAPGGASCGTSVAISGDVAIVGCWRDNVHGDRSGSAYIYRDVDGVFAEEQKLTASDGEVRDYFGNSVAISGDVAVVGAWADDDMGSQTGAAYVFRYLEGSWTEEQKLVPSDAAADDSFSEGGVSVSGDVILIGSLGDDDNGDRAGSAYVFRRNGSVWVESQKLLASDGPPPNRYGDGSGFGSGVSISGDVAVVGSFVGAYLFREADEFWTEEQKLTLADTANTPLNVVSVDGNAVLVGQAGSAYLFRRSGSSWKEVQKLVASDPPLPGMGSFGVSVSIEGDVAVVGDPGDDDNGPFSGSAYVYSALPTPVAVDQPAGPPFSLHQNYPNPFRSHTTISYHLSSPDHVRLEVFDLLGRRVQSIVDDVKNAGEHRIAINGEDLPGGTYFYKLQTPNSAITKAMLIER